MSHVEFQTMVKEMFEVADENHDEVLVLDEFKQFSLFIMQAMTNLKVDKASHTVTEIFTNFDINKDGKLDWDEIWASMEPLEMKIKNREFTWEGSPTMTPD